MSKVKQGYIYPARKGCSRVNGFNYYLCCMTGDFYIVDCLPCKKDGRTAPGYECGVPTNTSDFYVSRGKPLDLNN
jgi:hypothetical protein